MLNGVCASSHYHLPAITLSQQFGVNSGHDWAFYNTDDNEQIPPLTAFSITAECRNMHAVIYWSHLLYKSSKLYSSRNRKVNLKHSARTSIDPKI